MEQIAAGFNPSPQQRALYDYMVGGSGNMILRACAGTGKTTTIVNGVRYMQGDVFYGAFNKPIAAEIDFKIKGMTGIDHSRIDVRTIHSACMRAWRKSTSGYKLTVNQYKMRGLFDELVEETAKDQRLQYMLSDNQGFLLKLINYAKGDGFGVLCLYKQQDNWHELIEHFNLEQDMKGDATADTLIPHAIDLYERSLNCCKHEIDFPDMLLAPLYFKSRFPKYDWLVIDEAQDISPIRLASLGQMVKPTTRVIAVGDPHQAIYGFTGADSEALNSIKDRFDCDELPLSVTYRCPKVVVELAQQWVPEITADPNSPHGSYQTCWLKPKPADGINDIPQTGFWELGPFTKYDAILCRNTKPLVALAYEFLRKQVPVMVEGRDIGKTLITLATRWKATGLIDLELNLHEYKKREIDKFNKLKMEYKAAMVEDQVETLLTLIEATKDSGGQFVTDLINLINNMFGDTPEGEMPKCTILATVHKSKGREWPRVFILGRAKFMPSKWAVKKWEMEQEDNLQYVAVTRAKETLVEIVVPD